MDQPDQGKVRRHLVGDALPVAGRGRQGRFEAVEIPDPEQAQLLARHDHGQLGDRQRDAGGLAEAFQRVPQVQTFAGAEDFRMARQDLLDQAGAGARHADDKDRQRRRIALTGFRAHQLGAENRFDPIEHPQCRRLVMVDLLPFQRIAFEEMVQGPLMLADIREGLPNAK